MQQYLQHEYYALWEVIEFGDSYTTPESSPSTMTTSTTSGDKSGRTVTLTTEDMQNKKNDVKARTTLLLSLPDEHHLRFSKHKTAKELWAAILKTFGGNEATKKTKKNLLKQYLAPEWLMHTIVWRNMTDLDTMSLDDLYNHLKVYEAEVQKKSELNTQNMAFISSTKHSRGNDESLERNFDLRRISFKSHFTFIVLFIKMDHQYPTVAKIPVLDTGKFEQWQFLIQQYLQHEHYALWEVIEFGDSYKVPTNTDPNDTSRRKDDEQSGRTVTITTEDMQRKKNDATKKRKKNLLKQQYGNFKAEGLETLEQMFNRLQVVASQLQFMDVEVEKNDLNKKFLTSLAPEWMMHTIVWRNRNDLDTMSLDDLYNHLKVYEAEVQTKSNSNSQNMAFISSSKNSSGNEDGNIACVSTASTTFPTSSINIATISQDTASTYIASQSNGSQIKFEDINQIDEDDMEEIDVKWSMALLSMRADKFWKRTGKKISIQGSDVVGEDHALVADGETPIEFALMANTESKVFDNSLYSNDCKKNTDSLNSNLKDLKNELSEANNYFYHYKLAVAQLEGKLTKYKEREVKYIEKIRTLEMYRASNLKSIKALDKELEEVKLEKDGLDGKLAGLLKASKNLDHLIESQRSNQVKEGVGYNVVPPPAADLYLSPKKDLSWTGLPEFVDDTVTDYSKPSPTIAITSAEGQNKDSSTSEDVASPNPPKPFVKFVKPNDSQPESKSKEHETPKKPQVKYVEQYRHSNKKPKTC
nr:hypothetical protein [Tanacetum cinerariifolium]